MRYTKLIIGTTRIKSHFLLFPKTINGETRWLEKATYEQKFIRSENGTFCYWTDTKWINY